MLRLATLLLGVAALAPWSETPQVRTTSTQPVMRTAADTLPIRATITDAESEGAAFNRAAAPETTSYFFTTAADGTTERRCVKTWASALPSSLRSGEIIIRARPDFRSGSAHKILWAPLHEPYDYHSTLLLRAARIGAPASFFRQEVKDWAYSPGSKVNSAFPSEVVFPNAGDWLVVATAGTDWGCFLFRVTDN